jgi:hypothetical protein
MRKRAGEKKVAESLQKSTYRTIDSFFINRHMRMKFTRLLIDEALMISGGSELMVLGYVQISFLDREHMINILYSLSHTFYGY